MKPQDLRLTNLVQYNGLTMQVVGIQMPEPRKDKRYSDKNLIDLFDGSGLILCVFDEISPIPLTEEWLLKFGFIAHGIIYARNAERGLAIKFWNEKSDPEINYIVFWNNHVILYMKELHVHQLQNLYYSLTNTELTWNGEK